MMNDDNKVEGKNLSSEPKWLLITVIIGAAAGIIGSFARGSDRLGGIGVSVHLYFWHFMLCSLE